MEVERVSSIYVGAEETAVPGVGVDSGAVVHGAGLAHAQAGFPVVKAQTFAAARHGGQLPPALPAHGPATVAQGVAVAVIGDLLPVIGYQSCRFPSLSSRQGLSALTFIRERSFRKGGNCALLPNRGEVYCGLPRRTHSMFNTEENLFPSLILAKLGTMPLRYTLHIQSLKLEKVHHNLFAS